MPERTATPAGHGRAARRGVAAALLLLAAASACADSTGPSGPVVDLRGTWSYSGTQAAPALTLLGTLVITDQTEDRIRGTLTWEERDGVGGVTLKAAQVAGLAVGMSDTDFDVQLAEGTRRHIGLVVADTISGVWAASSAGQSGQFRAVRGATP